MTHYKNISTKSEVKAYAAGNTFIEVTFNTGSTYLYTNSSAGSSNIETMKKLAADGLGLHSFIQVRVPKKYAFKIS